MKIKIVIASDHAGFLLKQDLIKHLKSIDIEVIDLGTNSEESVDYSDYAFKLANHLRVNNAYNGILICGSGIGISIAANRFSHIRAALCRDEEDAILARKHNDANVLVIGSRITNFSDSKKILNKFLNTEFEGGRHRVRVEKMSHINKFFYGSLAENDPDIFAAIQKELSRQQNCIELIASENIVSSPVLEAQGSILTNKYAEGYSGKRYYGGCEFVDIVENIAIERAKQLFNAGFANVQPHSGSQANQAVFMALLNPGDTVLGMSLNAGGHLTHGAKVNQSGKWFNSVTYSVDPDTYLINIDEVRMIASEHRPKLIIAGGSAYPRFIDFAGFRNIADQIGAYFMVDMAHFAGLVAAGIFPNPLSHAHVVTTTTHKTLRGPRGGMILTNDEKIAKLIDSAIFPGLQGGPLMHVIAAKAVAFGEALTDDFKEYINAVADNAKILAKTLINRGYKVLTNGTDCHLLLVDLRPKKLTGKIAEQSLERAGLTCNKNSIPFDIEKPTITSGIRIGTPAGTSRGFRKEEFEEIANMIADILDGLQKNYLENNSVEQTIKAKVTELCKKFPIY